MPSLMKQSSLSVRSVAPFVAVLVLVGLMIADTTFLTAEESAEVNGPVFTAEAYAEKKFPEISDLIAKNAIDLGTVVTAIGVDREGAGAEYGISLGAGRYVYQVKLTATVESVDEDWLIFATPDLPEEADSTLR